MNVWSSCVLCEYVILSFTMNVCSDCLGVSTHSSLSQLWMHEHSFDHISPLTACVYVSVSSNASKMFGSSVRTSVAPVCLALFVLVPRLATSQQQLQQTLLCNLVKKKKKKRVRT